MRTSTHRRILWLGVLMLALGLGNLGRMIGALRGAVLLPNLPMTVSWTHLAVMGGLWGLVFITSAAGLFRYRPWAPWLTLVAVALYEIHVWANHLLFDASDYAHRIWPRDLALTSLLLVVVGGLLSLKSTRSVLAQNQERLGIMALRHSCDAHQLEADTKWQD